MERATQYLCEFDRVGARRGVPPLDTSATDAEELAEQVYKAIRRVLSSREIGVVVDLEKGVASQERCKRPGRGLRSMGLMLGDGPDGLWWCRAGVETAVGQPARWLQQRAT